MRVACFCGAVHDGPVCPECDAPPLRLGTPDEIKAGLAMREQLAEIRGIETKQPDPIGGPES